ncbi:hypothetical protein Tco_1155236 [Tanacetum coccineum]
MYHIGGPSSTDPYVTARASDRYSWEHLMDHPRHPTGPRPNTSRYLYMVTGVPRSHASGMTFKELKRMQYLYGGVRDYRIGVDCQAELLLEMLDIAGRLTQQITRSICTAEGAIMIGMRAWYLGLLVVLLLLSWIEGIESKLYISKCSDNSKVEYAACLLQGRALTWWNTQVQTPGREDALQLT